MILNGVAIFVDKHCRDDHSKNYDPFKALNKILVFFSSAFIPDST